jgi:hypothetical protein
MPAEDFTRLLAAQRQLTAAPRAGDLTAAI